MKMVQFFGTSCKSNNRWTYCCCRHSRWTKRICWERGRSRHCSTDPAQRSSPVDLHTLCRDVGGAPRVQLVLEVCSTASDQSSVNPFSTWRLHVAWMYAECAHGQHVSRTVTLTLTHTIIAYSVGGKTGNVVRGRIVICATRQQPCRKRVYPNALRYEYTHPNFTHRGGFSAVTPKDCEV